MNLMPYSESESPVSYSYFIVTIGLALSERGNINIAALVTIVLCDTLLRDGPGSL